MKYLISLVSALALVSVPAIVFSKEAIQATPLSTRDASAKTTPALTQVPASMPKSTEHSQSLQNLTSGGGQARSGSKLSLSLMFGGGLGMINADARVTNQPELNIDEGKGFTLSSVHLNLEVDYRLAERFQLGVFARAQSTPTLLGGLQGQYRWFNGDRVSLSARLGVGYGTLSYDIEVIRGGLQDSGEGQIIPQGILYKVGNLLSMKVGSYVELLGSVDFLHVLPLNACPTQTSCDSSARHFDFNFGVSYLF